MNYIGLPKPALFGFAWMLILLACPMIISDGTTSKALKRDRDQPAGLEAAIVGDTESEPPTRSDGEKVHLPRVLDFREYAIKFNKVYSATEWMAKANLFLARVINIFRHNARFLQKEYSYFLSLNAFTDISAKEFQAIGSGSDPALESVEESKQYPADMPANELPAVQQLTGSMGFSMLAANEDGSNSSTEAYEARYGDGRAPKKESLVDFSHEEDGAEDVNVTDFYRQFMHSLDAEDAERVSKVIDLNSRLRIGDEKTKLVDSRAKQIMRDRKIKYRPVVSPTNANYDGTNIVSHGVYDNIAAGRAFSEKMSAFLNYDVDITDDLSPYEPPTKKSRTPDSGQIEGESESKKTKSSYFSSFFSTAKGMAKSVASRISLDAFSLYDYDDLGYLDLEEDEEEEDDDDEDSYGLEREREDKVEERAKRIKYTVDWRVTGCISRPKSQDSCNACYAFTVVAMMEYYHCRQTRQLTEFSAQYIVDCGRLTNLNGCQGGYLSKVGKFIKLHGLELQAMYPYSGQEGQCPYEASERKKMGYLRPTILNWTYVKRMADWYEHIKRGPLLVGIGMPADFLAYGGGIHDGSQCDPQRVHAMLLVGSGSQAGKEFWLFKNSFSQDWGENGYFRLAKDAPLKCFNSGVVVRVNFKRDEPKDGQHPRPV